MQSVSVVFDTNMSSKTPIVSVLTTSYNREAYIAETIESVLSQTMTDFEYIIVDDCSKDRTFEIAQSFARKDSRIRTYRNETNLGDYPNRNKAASYATGKYLKYIDSDDLLYPHALDVCVWYMDRFRTAGLGLSQSVHDAPLPELLSPEDSYKRHFLKAGLFGNAPGSVVIRRETFEGVGRFTGKRMIGDFEMWLLLAQIGNVVLFPGLIHWDRRHPGQESNFDQLSYAALRRDVAVAALSSVSCPLGETDLTTARHRVRLQAATIGVRQLFRRLSLRQAPKFLRESGCSVSEVLQATGSLIPGANRFSVFKN